MALQKEFINDAGVVTTYHRVDRATLNGSNLMCSVASYVSSEYRELGQPVTINIYNFTITLAEEESMGIRKLCYAKLKELEEWSDSIDC